MVKFFIGLICVTSVVVCGFENVNKLTVDQLQQFVQSNDKNILPSYKARCAVKLSQIKDVKNVDTLEKVESIYWKNRPDNTKTFNRDIEILSCCFLLNLDEKVCLEAFNKYGDNYYAKINFVLNDFPKSKKYTFEEKKEACLFVLNHFVTKVKSETVRNRYIYKYFKYYVDLTKNLDSSIIKKDLLPLYREAVIKLSDDASYKNIATKIGLVLRSCGADIK